MKLHKESHIDHVPQSVIDYILELFSDKREFFTTTIELSEETEPVLCDLYGPAMGDDPVVDGTFEEKRGDREYTSRMIQENPRPTRTVTVIAGPHDGEPCILYTVFGGPLAPKEPNDPTLSKDERKASEDFWGAHALAAKPPGTPKEGGVS